MKNITLLLLLTLLAAFVFASPEAEAEAAPVPGGYGPNINGPDWGKRQCMNGAPNVQAAIERYCRPFKGTAGRYVPGTKQGTRVGNAFVNIDAGCSPAQWLPWDICYKQFYNMCITQPNRGRGTKRFGNNGCQKWIIDW